MGADGKFLGQVTIAKDFDSAGAAVGQAGLAQEGLIYARAVIETIQCFEVDRDVARGMAGIVKAALGNAADERHLAAFETDTDRAAGTSGLALATAPAGFTVAAGFALAEPLAAVLGSGPWFEIVQSHFIRAVKS